MRSMRKRMTALLLAAVLCLACSLGALAEKDMPLLGSWAFGHEPETVVLQVSEDGTASYLGEVYTWEKEEDGRILLKDAEGGELPLRYMVGEDQTVLYRRTVYHRGKDVEGQGGLIGIWEGEDDGSSFVFTPAGYFLEDNTFSGNFMIDEAQGTFLLHYGDLFADTLCYFSVDENDLLTVEYPWPITAWAEK